MASGKRGKPEGYVSFNHGEIQGGDHAEKTALLGWISCLIMMKFPIFWVEVCFQPL